MSTFVLTSAIYGIFSVNKWSFSIFLTLQGAWLHNGPMMLQLSRYLAWLISPTMVQAIGPQRMFQQRASCYQEDVFLC